MEQEHQPSQSQTIETLLSIVEEQRSIIEKQQEQIAALTARVAELERQLGLNSSNSSKPPSSDGLKKTAPREKPAGENGQDVRRATRPQRRNAAANQDARPGD